MPEPKCLILRALLIAKMRSKKICISGRFARNWNALTSIIYISIARFSKRSWHGKVLISVRVSIACGVCRSFSINSWTVENQRAWENKQCSLQKQKLKVKLFVENFTRAFCLWNQKISQTIEYCLKCMTGIGIRWQWILMETLRIVLWVIFPETTGHSSKISRAIEVDKRSKSRS